MAVSESNILKSLLNMDGSGTIGGFPDPGTSDPIPTNRHLLGGFPFEGGEPEPGDGGPILDNDYFVAPTDETMARSASSELPDGKAWLAKNLYETYIYALVFAWAACFNSIRRLVQTVAREMNINTTNQLIGDHEKSVGLPDARLGISNPTLQTRRDTVIDRLSKSPSVLLEEMQSRIDVALPTSGIWLSLSKGFFGGFRYTFRYPFKSSIGNRDRFVMIVNYPEFAEDVISWENLLSFLRDFSNAGILFIQNVIPKDQSYVVITSPQTTSFIYSESDGMGGYKSLGVKWKKIDKLNTVEDVADQETILPATTEIARSFVDSDTVLIEGKVFPTVVVL